MTNSLGRRSRFLRSQICDGQKSAQKKQSHTIHRTLMAPPLMDPPLLELRENRVDFEVVLVGGQKVQIKNTVERNFFVGKYLEHPIPYHDNNDNDYKNLSSKSVSTNQDPMGIDRACIPSNYPSSSLVNKNHGSLKDLIINSCHGKTTCSIAISYVNVWFLWWSYP